MDHKDINLELHMQLEGILCFYIRVVYIIHHT